MNDTKHAREDGLPIAMPSDTGPFTDWLAREMPPGTVISNPRWWAPRILRQIARLATPEQPGSSVQGEAVQVLRIPRSKGLDPITVFVEDVAPGAGRVTIACYNQAWTGCWGAMGTRSVLHFIASCDEHYIAANLLNGRRSYSDEDAEDSEREYVNRIALAVIAAAKAYTPPPAPAAEQVDWRPEQPEGKGAWTEDKLRAAAKERGWYLRESASVPTEDGWRHPFEVSIPSHDLLRILAAAPAAPGAAVEVDEAIVERLGQQAYEVYRDTPIQQFPDDSHAPKWQAVVRMVIAALAGKAGAAVQPLSSPEPAAAVCPHPGCHNNDGRPCAYAHCPNAKAKQA